MASKWKKFGIIATVAGAVIGVASTLIDEKKNEETLQEMVDKKFAEREEKEEES